MARHSLQNRQREEARVREEHRIAPLPYQYVDRLPNRCLDIVLQEEVPFEEGNIQFIINEIAICFSKQEVIDIIQRKDERGNLQNWFYECKGGINDFGPRHTGEEIFIKMPLDPDGSNVFVSKDSLDKMLLHGIHRVLVVPVLGRDGVQRSFTRSASWIFARGHPKGSGQLRNADDSNDFYGANHCQGGSTILLYQVVEARQNPLALGKRRRSTRKQKSKKTKRSVRR